jgi:hypothetical protein
MLKRPTNLDEMARRDLRDLAQSLGVADAEVMTRAELRAAIERSQNTPPSVTPPWPTTWLGVARGLLASIVEQGLNLPDAAALIRGDTKLSTPPKPSPPVATVTLARIYAAQGHLARAISTLEQVLESDPDHELARELRDEFSARAKSRGVPVKKEVASEPPASAELASSQASGTLVEPAPLTELEPASPPSSELEPAPPTLLEPPPDSVPEPSVPEPAPTLVEPAPVIVLDPPASAALQPPSGNARPGAAAAQPPSRPAPVSRRPAALANLVVLETSARASYVCWEVSNEAVNGEAGGRYSLLVVAHTPLASGSTRHERRLALDGPSGLLRLRGLPERAVVRALLTIERAATKRTLAVSGSVTAHEPPADPELKVTFSPRVLPNPAELAARAIERLASASIVDW